MGHLFMDMCVQELTESFVSALRFFPRDVTVSQRQGFRSHDRVQVDLGEAIDPSQVKAKFSKKKLTVTVTIGRAR